MVSTSLSSLGKGTSAGRKIARRGRPKYLGGIGKKVTSCTRRTFKPNIQTVNALVDGRPQRIKVTTRVLRQGLVQKPLKRKYAYTRKQRQAAAH